MRLPIAVLLAALVPGACWGQKKEVIELGRDLALLQEEVRAMKQSQDQRLTGIEASLKTILDQINGTSRQVTVLDSGLRERIERSVTGQMTTLGGKVDSLGQEFTFVRESVGEVNSRLNKLQQQVVDLSNAIKTMQAPPAPPPGAETPGTPPPGVSATSLYQDARRDKSSGNSDLALKGFNDYLAWFGSTDAAPEAQYFIGEILYEQKKFEEALKAFDKVLEAYPRNPKTLDAHFMKGRSLVRLNKRNEGADEYREIIRLSPKSDIAARARVELKDLGLSATPPARRPK
jgi:TolA-binding protein